MQSKESNYLVLLLSNNYIVLCQYVLFKLFYCIFLELKWPQSVAQKSSKCPKVLGPVAKEVHSDRGTRELRGLKSKLVVEDIIAEEVYWTEEEKQSML